MNITLYIILTILILIIVYGYNSGSCKVQKNFICNKDFCLYKEFSTNILNYNLKKSINNILLKKNLQKRVSVSIYPEVILNCAVPNKSGVTISTVSIVEYAPDIIQYYQNDLCKIISKLVNLKLYPTELTYPTSCAILIYEDEGDWINWHYDYNYYNGRFFTVLIPITSDLTCTKFQFMNNNTVTSLDLVNKGICFEGNYLYHRASKLCKNQKRVMLSCQYVTDNTMSLINQTRIKLKDYAYIGKF